MADYARRCNLRNCRTRMRQILAIVDRAAEFGMNDQKIILLSTETLVEENVPPAEVAEIVAAIVSHLRRRRRHRPRSPPGP